MHADNDPLQTKMNAVDVGASWLTQGHNAKISLDWQHCPVDNSDLTRDTVRAR